MRYLLSLLILFSLAGCTYVTEGRGDWVKKIDPDEASRLILTYAVKLEGDRRLHLDDSFIIHDNFIQKFHMEFYSMDILELKEARELLVDVVEGFLKQVNENEFMRGQIADYPLTADDLEIYIYFESYYDHYVDRRMIGLITLRCGISYFMAYDMFDHDNNHQNWWHERCEYYWQSRNFVKFSREGEFEYKLETARRKSQALKYDQYIPPANVD